MRLNKVALISLGILALAGIAAYAGIGPVIQSLAELKVAGLAIITLVHLPVIFLMGLAWWCIGSERGAGLWAFIAARLGRDAVAEILPLSQLGGFLAGARLLTRAGVNAANAAFSLFADLIAEFAAKLIYTLLGLVVLARLLPESRLLRPFAIALAVIIAALLVTVCLYGRFKPSLQRLAAGAVQRLAGSQSSSSTINVFAYRRLLPSLGIHLLCWLFGTSEAWITLRLMGIGVSGAQAFVIDSLATAFRSLGFLMPASLGVQEAGYVLISALFGLSPATAVAFSLARRARDIIIGLMGLVIWQRMEWRSPGVSKASARYSLHSK
jgi:glycosyltransferase 2 family protein